KIKRISASFVKVLACFSLCAGLSACSLEEIPLSEATPDMLYSTPSGIRDGVYGVYSQLRGLYGSQQGCTPTPSATELLMHRKDGGNKAMDLYSTELDPSMSYLYDVWNTCYRAINGANTVLERVDAVPISEEQKNQYRAEARFLRAHFYYWLTIQFGDVVWTDQETKGVITDAGRTAKAEIWQHMKADTEFAVEHLDWTPAAYGRATKGAALHQLASILLLLGENQAAGDAAARVIAEGPYNLLDDYAAVFDYGNQQNSEIVFAV